MNRTRPARILLTSALAVALTLGAGGCASEDSADLGVGSGQGTGVPGGPEAKDGDQNGGGGGGSGGGGGGGSSNPGSSTDASGGGGFGGADAGASPGGPGQGGADDGANGGGSGTPGEGGGGEPWPGGDAGGGAASDAGAPPFEPDAGSTDAGSEDAGEPDDAPTCNTTDEVKLYLSADDSNSMAGAQIARGLIAQGQYAYKAIRTYEMLNYYAFEYPAAEQGHVAVSAQMRLADAPVPSGGGGGGASDESADAGSGAPAEAADAAYHLQIGVRAPDFSAATRRRVNVVFAVDTSSSMGWGTLGQTGIDDARNACLALVDSLEANDVFSLVTWGGTAKVVVDSYTLSGKDDGTLQDHCNALAAGGRTDLSSGLNKAYEVAKKGFAADRINRVILVSDGGANVGETDEQVIAEAAKDADGEAIYLMGVGVGDPWNYNDSLMNAVTDAGRGAYVFLDTGAEAWSVFKDGFLRHLEVAARDVQVEVTLPPTFGIQTFYGEEYSENPDEVEPQHLAANDAMVFHQIIASCDPSALTGNEVVKVVATWKDPITKAEKKDSYEASFASLLAGDTTMLRKGDAVVAYAEALADTRFLEGAEALARIDEAIAAVEKGLQSVVGDVDLQELQALLTSYKDVFSKGQAEFYPTGGTGAGSIDLGCSCEAVGADGVGKSLDAMACALDLCGSALVSSDYSSPTSSPIADTFAAVERFGDGSNDLDAKKGGSYALMASGWALGTQHSVDVGGVGVPDPVMKGGASMYNAMEWTLKLKAPTGANGIRFKHVFFSQEYDEYVGSNFNDKFYVILQAGSTNGGAPTVINYTDCRNPDTHYDFVCSPGMQFCNPRARYCYIAINTALSECCWLGGCPDGTATTDIGGTGFSCAASQSADSSNTGSSTGWLVTEWPIEPGETFEITFHVHDTGDGIYDSEVILDAFEFVESVTPGTWPLPAM